MPSISLTASNFTLLSVLLAPLLAAGATIPSGRSSRNLHKREHVDDVNICRPLDTGRCTLSVITSLTVVPNLSDDPGENLSSAVDGKMIVVMDHKCNTLESQDAIEPQGIGNGFSGPVSVKGFNSDIDFHADVLGLGDTGGIEFSYAGKDFSDCDCENVDTGNLVGMEACRCEFDCPKSAMSSQGYRSGWCRAHITQNQKPDPVTDDYTLEIQLYDDGGIRIGGTPQPRAAPSGQPVDMSSELPYMFIATAHDVDDDPLSFAYAGDKWDSNKEGRCSVGAYDSGDREMDCYFGC